jgi:hypothetical protein
MGPWKDFHGYMEVFLGSMETFQWVTGYLYPTQRVKGIQPATESRRNEEMKMQVYE